MNHQVPRVISYLQRQHIQIHRIQIIRFLSHVADHADADVFGGIVALMLVYPVRGVEHFAVIAKPQNPAVWSVDDADVEALTLAFLEAVISNIVTDFFRKERQQQLLFFRCSFACAEIADRKGGGRNFAYVVYGYFEALAFRNTEGFRDKQKVLDPKRKALLMDSRKDKDGEHGGTFSDNKRKPDRIRIPHANQRKRGNGDEEEILQETEYDGIAHSSKSLHIVDEGVV